MDAAGRQDAPGVAMREPPSTEEGRFDRRGPATAGPALLVGCLLAGAVVAAPFLALLFARAAGLAVMGLALGATAYLTRDAARSAAPALRRRLLVAAAVNGVLALACVVALVAVMV